MVNRLKQLSLYIFYGLLAYMPLHIFISTVIGTTLGSLEFAKVAKDFVLVIGFVFALVASIKQPWFKQLFRDKLAWLVLGYVGLTILLALIKPTEFDAELLGLVYNARFLLMAIYAGLLVNLFNRKAVLKKSMQIVLVSGVAVATFGVMQYLLIPNDALTHVGYSRENGVLPVFFIDDKPDLERVMSTVRDPNSLGSYLIILLSITITLLLQKRNKKYALFLFVTLLCLWFTFSRSAWVGALIAVGVLLLLSEGRVKNYLVARRQILIPGVVVCTMLFAGSLYAARNSYFIQNVIFHADESTALEDPNQLRVRFLRESLGGVLDDPIGSGPGTAGLASIRNETQGTELNENYYLQIASEVGIIGVVLFLGILAVVGWRLYGLRADPISLALLASFIGLAFANLLVHIWSNEAVAYTWWALAGLTVSAHIRNERNKLRR